MYDENLIEDSLEVCKNLDIIRKGTDVRKLFDDMRTLNESSASHLWEKALDVAGTDSIKQYEEQPDYSYPANSQSYGSSTVKKKINKKNILHNLILAVLCAVTALFLSAFINSNIAHQTTIKGESMKPLLENDDSVIIQKLSYYWKDPGRYDIIVFPVTDKDKNGESIHYIKRVIGLPGEVVQIIEGKVYINGKPLDDDVYSDEKIEDPGIAGSPVQLEEDEYFVLGDNRNMSTDSRYTYVGMVKREDIEGEAWYCIWPFSHIKKI